jgi:hypothetical protein
MILFLLHLAVSSRYECIPSFNVTMNFSHQHLATLVRMNGKIMMGRLIVHDRIKVEKDILPRYFNHSSFASLRRQLNYFSFVRVGKGRQRESTYVNEHVVDIDDILHLKRRPAGAAAPDPEEVISKADTFFMITTSLPIQNKLETTCKRDKRINLKRRLLLVKNHSHMKASMPSVRVSHHHLVSDEDDSSDAKSHVTTTMAKPSADAEVLAGCSALLGLSGVTWE